MGWPRRTSTRRPEEQKEIEEKLAKAGVSATGDQPMIRRVLNPAKDLRREEVARAETELRARKVAYDDAKKGRHQLEGDNKKRVGISQGLLDTPTRG